MGLWRSALLLATAATAIEAKFNAFGSFPAVRCSACEAMADIIAADMNETAKKKSSVLKGSRLERNNERRHQRIDYESSELRAIEILERTCDSKHGKGKDAPSKPIDDYSLRLVDGVRVIGKMSEGTKGEYYRRSERSRLDEITQRLTTFCFESIEDHYDEFVQIIRQERTDDAVKSAMCNTTMQVCVNDKKLQRARRDERRINRKYKKAMERRGKREEKFKKIDEEREAVKKAKEEAEKKAKEAAEQADGPAQTSSAAEGSEVPEQADAPEGADGVEAAEKQAEADAHKQEL